MTGRKVVKLSQQLMVKQQHNNNKTISFLKIEYFLACNLALSVEVGPSILL